MKQNFISSVWKWSSSNILAILVTIAIAVGLRIVLHVPFGRALGVIVFFWLTSEAIVLGKEAKVSGNHSKTGLLVLGYLSRIAAVVYLGICIFHVNAPRTYDAVKIAMGIGDQRSAIAMGNNTDREAVDLWEGYRSEASQKFLDYYEGLLWLGLTQKAADTLRGFNKHWNTDLLKDKKDEVETEKQSSASVDQGQQSSASSSQISSYSGSESFSLLKDKRRATVHEFKAGDPIKYEVKAPVAHLTGNGEKVIIQPGVYSGTMSNPGTIMFEGVAEGVTEVTVYF